MPSLLRVPNPLRSASPAQLRPAHRRQPRRRRQTLTRLPRTARQAPRLRSAHRGRVPGAEGPAATGGGRGVRAWRAGKRSEVDVSNGPDLVIVSSPMSARATLEGGGDGDRADTAARSGRDSRALDKGERRATMADGWCKRLSSAEGRWLVSARTARFTSGGTDLRRRQRGLWMLLMPGGRQSAIVAILVLLGLATFAAGAAADGTHGQGIPRMHFGDRVGMTTVCFSVTNPAGGQSPLYGLRYIDRGARVDPRTPAIVLVHGIASSTETGISRRPGRWRGGWPAAGYVVYLLRPSRLREKQLLQPARRGAHVDDRWPTGPRLHEDRE